MATADTAAIDDFLNAFRAQIDTGFGLISGDVHTVFGTLIIISVGSSALMWVLDEGRSIPAEFIRKILLIGFFAWLIDNWRSLATSVVQGFAVLGLKVGAGSLTADDFLGAPTKVISSGFDAALKIIAYIGTLAQQGYGIGVFTHLDVILISAVSAVGILISFVILAAEIAVTLVEFHVVTLIAFVTIPFGIISQTAFLADRAIGFVIAVGLKVMALGIVVSVGQGVFATYVVSASPTAAEECGLLLSSVLMLALALKIPKIASGLVSGGPTLTAGAAISGFSTLASVFNVGAAAGRMGGDALNAGRSLLSPSPNSVDATLAAAGLSDRPPSKWGFSRRRAEGAPSGAGSDGYATERFERAGSSQTEED